MLIAFHIIRNSQEANSFLSFFSILLTDAMYCHIFCCWLSSRLTRNNFIKHIYLIAHILSRI